METENLGAGNSREDIAAPLKRKYQKPLLETYGLVKNLTQGAGSGMADGGAGQMGGMGGMGGMGMM